MKAFGITLAKMMAKLPPEVCVEGEQVITTLQRAIEDPSVKRYGIEVTADAIDFHGRNIGRRAIGSAPATTGTSRCRSRQ
jgi:hypothetical protein